MRLKIGAAASFLVIVVFVAFFAMRADQPNGKLVRHERDGDVVWASVVEIDGERFLVIGGKTYVPCDSATFGLLDQRTASDLKVDSSDFPVVVPLQQRDERDRFGLARLRWPHHSSVMVRV